MPARTLKTSTVLQVGSGAGRKQVRLLFTCAGRRVELIRTFRRAAGRLGIKAVIHTADADPMPAAACVADRAVHVPPVHSPDYVPALLALARRARIDLLIPLIDNELVMLADARDKFARVGCGVLISSPEVVRLCRDKMETYRFLTRHGIDTPRTWLPEELSEQSPGVGRYFLKPRAGSASQGNYRIENLADIAPLLARVSEAIVQEYVEGTEYTLDVYTGFDGRPRCVVPRQRIEVRGGEVTKARTVRHEGIIQTGFRVAEALADCRGLVTIQLILTPEGRIAVLEINPRFGGGVPLAIQAGADFPRWLMAEWLGRKPRIGLNQFRENVLMLRYHHAFFRYGVKDAAICCPPNGG